VPIPLFFFKRKCVAGVPFSSPLFFFFSLSVTSNSLDAGPYRPLFPPSHAFFFFFFPFLDEQPTRRAGWPALPPPLPFFFQVSFFSPPKREGDCLNSKWAGSFLFCGFFPFFPLHWLGILQKMSDVGIAFFLLPFSFPLLLSR